MNSTATITKNSHRTTPADNILYHSSNVGGKKCVEKQGEVVKDFMIGKTRIKINDAYCNDKTPADIERILANIAIRAQEHLTAQAITKSK